MRNRMGKTIALFRLYRDTGEEEWSMRAEELLDDIWNECTGDMSLAYEDGLCGIGAGIEYLIQNDFVEGDADEVLAEIDSRVCAVINARPPFDLSIGQGILGLACYLYHRLCYRKDSEMPVVLNLKEYTIYLIDWIAEALQDNTIGKDYYEAYFILVLLHTLNIMNAKIENLLEWCDKEIAAAHLKNRSDNQTMAAIMKSIPSMPPVSIVIPVRIESTEREENLHCVLQYLLRSPFVYIELLEADKERHFFFTHHERIRYRFVYDEEPVFYRTHYLNELLREAQHSIVGIWDADVLVPEAQLITAAWHILEGCVLCFPYNGICRFLEKERSNAIRINMDELQTGEGYCLLGRPSAGGAFLVDKIKYLEAGGENEGFYGWGPEDAERVKRLEILELPIARTEGVIYHLHHERKPDIGVDNRKKAQHNQKVFLDTCRRSKEELTKALKNHTGIFFI